MFERLTQMLEAESDKLAYKNLELWYEVFHNDFNLDAKWRKETNKARRKRARKKKSK